MFFKLFDISRQNNHRRSDWARGLERPQEGALKYVEVIILQTTGKNHEFCYFWPRMASEVPLNRGRWATFNSASKNASFYDFLTPEITKISLQWPKTSALVSRGCMQSFNLLALKLRPWCKKLLKSKWQNVQNGSLRPILEPIQNWLSQKAYLTYKTSDVWCQSRKALIQFGLESMSESTFISHPRF